MRFLKWLGYSLLGLIVLIALLIGGAVAWRGVANSTTLASWRGARDARADLSKGIYKEITYGLPVPWFWNYQKTMKSAYNVDAQAMGCMLTQKDAAYSSAYNKVAVEGIVHHFGHDVFNETSNQAEAEWNKAHPASTSGTTE